MDTAVDVVIVGSRCAGTSAAVAFRQAGRRVLLLDRATFPSDTISSHTMFEPALEELDRMGALERVKELQPPHLGVMEVDLSDGTDAGVSYRETLRPDRRGDCVLSVPRLLLDQTLVDTARAAGAEVRERCTVTEILWRGGRAAGVVYTDEHGQTCRVRASLVVGADGQFSTVAELVGAGTPYRYSHSARAAVYRYVDDPAVDPHDTETVYHWRDGRSLAFGFPTTPRGRMIVMFVADRAELVLARTDPEAYWAGKLAQHPRAAARMAGATNASKLRITDMLASYFRAGTGPGWVLAGDAGHFKDPILGQGIRDALWSGRTIAETVAPVLDDPAQLDRALRRWERAREVECMLPYLLGVLESRIFTDPDALRAIVRGLDGLHVPFAQALASRNGEARQLATPRRVGTLLHRGRAHSAGSFGRELMAEASTYLRLMVAARRSRFRDPRQLTDLENVAGGWPRRATDPPPALVRADGAQLQTVSA